MNTPQPRFELKHYDGDEIRPKSLSRRQYDSLDPTSYDHFMDFGRRWWGYRDRSGQWIDGGAWFGRMTLPLLTLSQGLPDIWVTAVLAQTMTGNGKYDDPAYFNRAVHLLRAAHGEVKTSDCSAGRRFILTPDKSPNAIMWPKHLTWAWVQPEFESSLPETESQEA